MKSRMDCLSSIIFHLICGQVLLVLLVHGALPPLIDGPENTAVKQGSQALLDCVFSENPTTTTLWVKDGLALNPDGGMYSYDGDINTGNYSLTINNVTLENDGNYRCGYTGMPPNSGLITDPVKLTVLVQPDNPEIVNYTTGEDYILQEDYNVITCIVRDGNPEANITWFIGSLELEGHNDVTNGSVEPLKTVTSQLVLNATDELHNEELYCTASHPSQENITWTFVVLKSKSPMETTVQASFYGTLETNISVPQGSNISMFCIADGFTEQVYYIWQTNNITLTTGQNITIEAEEGAYICAARNSENSSFVFSNELYVHVVEGNVTILEHPQNSTAKVGENLILNCTFSGFVDSCNWNKDGNYFLPGSNGYVNIGDESQGDCTLLIQNIQLEHEGIYFCEAPGAISNQALVEVLQAPKAPVFVLKNIDFPDNENIFVPSGTHAISCKSEDGKPGASITLFQSKCLLEGDKISEISIENPKLTTVTSTINVTIDETNPNVKLTCITTHPATEGVVDQASISVYLFDLVHRATANIVNHPGKSVHIFHGKMLDMICTSDSPSMADYRWEMKGTNDSHWKFLKSGPHIYMKAVAGTFRCTAENRFNNGKPAISNEISVFMK